VIFIVVLIGGFLLGIPGALLTVPVAEIIGIVVTELLAYRRTRQEANKTAVSAPSQPTTWNFVHFIHRSAWKVHSQKFRSISSKAMCRGERSRRLEPFVSLGDDLLVEDAHLLHHEQPHVLH
jgi:hypothetical protein